VTDSVARYPAAGDRLATLVLAHGASAGHRSPFMVRIASGLAARGVEVVTFDFPYVEQKRRVPDPSPRLEAAIAAAIGEAGAAVPVFIGGKSLGGRIATHLAAHADARARMAGVVVLGYPLHPPGRPEQIRTKHLADIAVPLLIVQGTRDALGTPDELRPWLEAPHATLHAVEGGDHSLAVRKGAGIRQQDVDEEILAVIRRWMESVVRG
jgi:predicted alpha/beta-hydrolase family hydrolase